MIMIGHVFTTPAVTTSGLTSGYLDIPGSSTSYLVHQSYLLRGVTGSNTFAETLSASQNHVAILIALVITEWSSIAESGKPFVTVSPGGIENGLATIPNNGADFGPDSTVGGVMTSTSGIQEALNYGYVNDAAVVLLEGTFNITSPIMLESYATLTGQGRQSVIQALAGFSSSGSLLYFDTTKGANIDNITIAHLAIIGNNGASSTGITATAGTGYVVDFLLLDDILIVGVNTGLNLTAVRGSSIRSIVITNQENTPFYGIYLQDCVNVSISGCYILACTKGLWFDRSSTTVQNQGIITSGCWILTCVTDLTIQDGLALKFSDCIFDTATYQDGIGIISGGTDIVFHGCWFASNNSATTQFFAISPADPAAFFTLQQIEFLACYFVNMQAGVNIYYDSASLRRPQFIVFDACSFNTNTAPGNYDVVINNADHVYFTDCNWPDSTGSGNLIELHGSGGAPPSDIVVKGGYMAKGYSGLSLLAGTILLFKVANVNPVPGYSVTAGASIYTFPLLPFDAVYVMTTVGGISALTLDGQGLGSSFFPGLQVFVGANHTLTAKWATTAPVFSILPL
ncbi:MAG: right-handed parallel beta-helix repeat-containing protein [Thermoplasmata archaeon]